ncbi:MAG: hypothetical protein K6C97_03970 [Treponema sp.]|nr:hypothetical protein [Treponema sp.]
MRRKTLYRDKALKFAKEEDFDSVSYQGIYQNYEVYILCYKSWSQETACTGLPQVILVNQDEVKWCDNPRDPFSLLDLCKK